MLSSLDRLTDEITQASLAPHGLLGGGKGMVRI
jgi:hypothetical protein